MNSKIVIRRADGQLTEPPFEHPFVVNGDGDIEREFKTALYIWRQAHPGTALFDDYVIVLEKAD